MNSDSLILRIESYGSLTTKGSNLTNTEFDDNFINVYKDLVAQATTEGVSAYSAATEYDDTVIRFATYDGRTWQYIHYTPLTGITPVEGVYWTEVFPSIMAHPKDQDSKLAEGTSDECTAAEIRAFIDAGLTSTTNLAVTTKTRTTFVITSSTGEDAELPQANETYAGLMSADDKIKVDNLEGVNTGDQSLASLGAEDTNNKVATIDPDAIVADSFPTVQAVVTYVQSIVQAVPFEMVCSELAVDLTVKNGAGYFFLPFDCDFLNLYADVRTAPTGADLTCDVTLDGVSILGTNELTIDAGETSSDTSAVTATMVTTSGTRGQLVEVDITQIGSTVAGQDLIVTLIIKRTVTA